MKLTEHVRCVFDDAAAGKLEAALLHACIAVDATARSIYPSEVSSRRRFVSYIHQYYWLIEPMMGVGINLEDTRFENVTIPKSKTVPDFADVVYTIHRSRHAHGDEDPASYELTRTAGPHGFYWEVGAEHLRMPDRVIWALTSIVIFCRQNARYRGWGETRYLTWGSEEKFIIADWWGREDELKPIASRWNTVRVTMKELGKLKEARRQEGEGSVDEVMIDAPPPHSGT